MAVALLDINDCNLRLWTDSARVESPGYVLLSGREYRFGEAARAQARLHPRNINNRFWWQLGTAPLQPALGHARHSADLVHAHLLELHQLAGEPQELVLACPGSMGREQLSLLLGIAQQCPFEIVGLVDRSALLGSVQHGEFHLELQLHQGLLTELTLDGGNLSAIRSTPLPGCGLLQIQEKLAARLASAFIQQTRFDPRRNAATEQRLYDAIPGLLDALAEQGEHNLELDGHRARITRTELAAASQPLVSAMRQAMGTNSVFADPLPARLPGLAEAFPELRTTHADTLWQAAQAQQAALLGGAGQLNFIDSLPLAARVERNGSAAVTTVAEPASQPTHLLQGAVAQPLGEGPVTLVNGLSLQHSGGRWTTSAPAEINGTRTAAGQPLASGDIIRVAGSEFRLIEVLGS